MMANEIISTFEKISFDKYLKYFEDNIKSNLFSSDDTFSDEDIRYVREIYDKIKIPTRSTTNSCGYDFYIPFDIIIPKGNNTLQIPTGIRCKMHPNECLILLPRSSSIKTGLRLGNSVGVIDADYVCSENEGDIILVLMNNNIDKDYKVSKFEKTISGKLLPIYQCTGHKSIEVVKEGEAICQGIILSFHTLDDEDTTNIKSRNGGFGSTNK